VLAAECQIVGQAERSASARSETVQGARRRSLRSLSRPPLNGYIVGRTNVGASIIFVKGKSADEPLRDFAAFAASAMGLTDVQERESSNYCDGHYFMGTYDGAEVTIYYLDTVGSEQYLFAVHVKPPGEVRADTLAQRLSEEGRFCFVPTGPWYQTSWDGRGTTYAP